MSKVANENVVVMEAWEKEHVETKEKSIKEKARSYIKNHKGQLYLLSGSILIGTCAIFALKGKKAVDKISKSMDPELEALIDDMGESIRNLNTTDSSAILEAATEFMDQYNMSRLSFLREWDKKNPEKSTIKLMGDFKFPLEAPAWLLEEAGKNYPPSFMQD